MSARAADVEMSGAAAARPRRRRFVAEISRDWREIERDWVGAGTAFQRPTWLATWYGEIADGKGVEPLLVTVRDPSTSEVALRLPLVSRRDGGLRVVEFADLNLTDFNAPLVGPAAPVDRAGAVAAVRAVRRALPSADLLRLAKMPRDLGARRNPLAFHPGAVESALSANVLRLGDDYDAWRRSLGRTYRKELERSWRVFTRAEGAVYERIADPERARDVMVTLERQQGERMREIGSAYFLDDPVFSRFYQSLVARGVEDGSIVVATLTAAGETVAAVVGIHGPAGFVFIRISNAGQAWSNCSPGRLIIERTMASLHAEGCRVFDFSIGDYEYKRRFGSSRMPLYDYVTPLGWRGLKAAARARIVGKLRSHPALDARLRALMSKTTASGS